MEQNKNIEHPKVFISYAWTSKKYLEKVTDFVCRLRGHGIDTLFDKWDVKPGNDLTTFMEKCVKDPEVLFVLMLLNKEYAKKANSRDGGVGVETQIISNEVYNNVEQTKFIPIVFERDNNGEVYIPTYLKSRLYFDLTGDSNEEEYQRLEKYIYGVEEFKKPPLGNRPRWVDENFNSPSALKSKVLMRNNPFNVLEEEIKNCYDGKIENEQNSEKIIEIYNKSLDYRNTLIEIFLDKCLEEKFVDDTCEFYENVKNWNHHNKFLKKEIWDSFIHETFIYLIAVLLKKKQYKKIHTFITKSYFHELDIQIANSYFYDPNYNEKIAKAKCLLDNKQYINGLAQIWIDNIYESKISRKEFTRADLLTYNLNILLYEHGWYWFPQTYIYDYDSDFGRISSLVEFSMKLKSAYEVNKIKDLFGVNDVEELKKLFKKMEIIKSETTVNRYRYPGAFNVASVILDYINIDEIGIYN